MGRYAVIPQLRAEIAELKDKLAKAREVEESSLRCLVRLANERNRAADEIERLRALLRDIDKSGLLTHAWKCGKVIGMLYLLPCDCGCDALQGRINAATEEPK